MVKLLCNFPVEDLLLEKIKSLPEAGDIVDWIPMSTKIAFRHPFILGIYIFISLDMLHLMKKINAMEQSEDKKLKTLLCFEDDPIQLKMIQHLW